MNLVEYIEDGTHQQSKRKPITMKSSNTYQQHRFKLKDGEGNVRDLKAQKLKYTLQTKTV